MCGGHAVLAALGSNHERDASHPVTPDLEDSP